MPDPMMPGSAPMPPEMPPQVPPSPMPEAPMSPGMAPGATPQFATDEQRQQLLDLIQQIRDKVAETNANMFAGGNQTQRVKMDALKEIFDLMKSSGVDLSDPAAVQKFIDDLKAFSPDIGQMFEDAMNDLLGGQGENTEQSQPMDMPDVTPLNESQTIT